MAENRKHIDDLYRDDLSEYSEAPRASVWDRIEDNLNKIENPGNTVTPKGPRGGRGFYYVLSGAVLIGAALFFAFQQSKDASAGKQVDNKEIAINTTVNTENNTIPDATKHEETNLNTTVSTTTTNSTVHKDVSHKETNNDNTEKHVENNISPATNTVVSSGAITPAVNNAPVQQMPVQKLNTVNKITALQNEQDKQSTVAQKTVPQVYVNKNTPVASRMPVLPSTKMPALTNAITQQHVNYSAPVIPIAMGTTTVPVLNQTQTPALTNSITQDGITYAAPILPILPGSTVEPSDPTPTTAPVKTTTGKDPIVNDEKTVITTTVQNKDEKKTNENVTEPLKENKDQDSKKEMLANKKLNQQEPIVPNANTTNAQATAKKQKKLLLKNSSTEPIANNATAVNDMLLNDKNEEKKDNTIPGNNAAGIVAEKEHKTLHLPFDLGVKGSLEQGTGKYAGNKGILSGYAELPLSKKMSLLFQPGFVVTALNRSIDYGTNPYYNNGVTDSTVGPPQVISGALFYQYHIYQKYDSMIVVRKSSKSLNVGFEMPVMVKYHISNSISVLGGVDINVSSVFTISESIPASYNVTTTSVDVGTMQPKDFQIVYRNFNPNHTSAVYVPLQQPTNNPIRLGYILGLGYKLNEKTDIELLMTQTVTNQDYIPDANIKSIYTQPYFRLSVGYRLFKGVKSK